MIKINYVQPEYFPTTLLVGVGDLGVSVLDTFRGNIESVGVCFSPEQKEFCEAPINNSFHTFTNESKFQMLPYVTELLNMVDKNVVNKVFITGDCDNELDAAVIKLIVNRGKLLGIDFSLVLAKPYAKQETILPTLLEDLQTDCEAIVTIEKNQYCNNKKMVEPVNEADVCLRLVRALKQLEKLLNSRQMPEAIE
ncbi:hypothetical protein [Evansella cellulosilytica]|uniref:Uncharacterized protein n=1 Tax=Evansella cellulosilytica (strain ATCC 21833 / DSM 2522 / FERM P-1141 / JCM 9156 / N-4) TaxID=649639 RepID=E6TT64_EVAC2|nr:hypothetical protein [Evansella cellulosilytica]ADU31972.1 hypothetical protein Bcell_3732 [Evansella cellulosilytica DSM 2522]